MNAPDPSPSLLAAFQEVDRDQRVRHSKIGCMLAMVLMPAGISLDYFVYPESLVAFTKARLLCDVGLALILALLGTTLGRRYLRILGVAWALLPAACIAWMIYLKEGTASPYYAGLNLVMIGVSLFMPWTFVEVVTTCSITIALYLLACLGNAQGIHGISIFFNNLYFLIITGVICVTTCYFNAGRRFEDFRLRHELAIRNRELAELDRAKSDFFANISHELRTPLTLILAPVQELLARPEHLSDVTRESLTIARQNALRLLRLINDLLEMVRLEAGHGRQLQDKINLATWVPGMVPSVRLLAETKQLRLVAEGTPEELPVLADPSGLEKVLLNLLSNAIKFTPAGGSVSVHWSRRDGQALLQVKDTGIGIAREDIPLVFKRFHQVDHSSTRKFQGAGIGLALTKGLVEQHGGRIEVSSEVGKGTTFEVLLPLALNHSVPAAATSAGPIEDPIAKLHHEAAQTVATPTAPAEIKEEGTAGPLVLVVDDESDMRRFLGLTLADHYRVIQAVDGKQGLDMIRERRPALVVLDLMLPEMDGLEVCRLVKAEPTLRHIKIILLTARTDETAKLTALKHGADDFLTKPFSTTEVRTRISNLLRAATLEEDIRQRNRDLEDALRKLKEAEMQLVQSEKMNALGKLSAGLLHEVNNPLNFTLTALQVARESIDANDADLQDTFNDIEQGMKRIRDIVTDLRTFAYPSEQILGSQFPIRDALKVAQRLVSHELRNLEFDDRDLADTHVCGSHTQISHVLTNLLANSAQALQELGDCRRGQIRVSSTREGTRLRLHVWDNGPGISAENLAKVCDPFFTTKDVGKGMGLGLSICHTIIRNHGGTLKVSSQLGHWTQVEFDLPLADPEVM